MTVQARRKGWAFVALILFASAGWKLILITQHLVPFNADEAVVALMARHILPGERPIFFYGQAYMGSLDAFLVAGGFLLFGQQVWVVRAVQLVLFLATLGTTMVLGRELFGKWRDGILAAAILAVPAVNVTLYTTASLGGYGEAILIGNVLLLLCLRLQRKPGWAGIAVLGFLAGLGLWANALTIVYTLPCLLYLGWGLRRQPGRSLSGWTFVLLAGGLAGSAPWWIYASQNGLAQLIMELTGSAVAVEHSSWISRVGLHFINLLLLGLPAALGLRPPWSVDWLALPLLPFALMVWGAIIIFWARKAARPNPERPVYLLLAGIPLTFSVGFLFTNFGVDPSGRYFLPLAVPLALTAVQMTAGVKRLQMWRWMILVFIGVFQLWGNVQVALTMQSGFTTQFDKFTILDHSQDSDLIAFLKSVGETRGYANYWVAYPLAFESNETVILAPRLPYHPDLRYTERDDRYPVYTRAVSGSSNTVYITTFQTPLLDKTLREGFSRLGVTWREKQVGDYRVFFALSRAVRPEEIGLGMTSE